MARVLIRVYHFNSRLRKETNRELYINRKFYKISTHVSVRRRTAKRINMLDLYFLIEQPQQQNGYHFLSKSLKIKIFSFQSMVRIP